MAAAYFSWSARFGNLSGAARKIVGGTDNANCCGVGKGFGTLVKHG
jgi:hypothetical protein